MLSRMKGSFGCELQRFLDQLPGLGEAHVAIGVRVTERVVGLCILRLQFDQLAQAAFHQLHASELFGQQGRLIEQVGLLGLLAQRAFKQIESGLGLLGVAQQGSFGDQEAGRAVSGPVRGFVQLPAGLPQSWPALLRRLALRICAGR
jgi:hypothetical protein